ncbi:MAG: hypothetical protein Fur0042_06370 [Cyanophyceae cyanobacterium]
MPLAAHGQFVRPPAIPDPDPNPLCYWLDAQGVRHNLTYLCGTGPAIAAPAAAPTDDLGDSGVSAEFDGPRVASSGDAIELTCDVEGEDAPRDGDYDVRVVGTLDNNSDSPIRNVVVRHQLIRTREQEGGGREFREVVDRGGSASIRSTIAANGRQEYTSNPKRVSLRGFTRLFAEVREITWVGADGQPGRRVFDPPTICDSRFRWR